MKRITLIVILGYLGVFAQKSENLLDVSYTISNNISPKLFEESSSFENPEGRFSDESIREIKSNILNASNLYSLYIDTKGRRSVFEIAPEYVSDEDDETFQKEVFMKAPFGYTDGKTYEGSIEFGNTKAFFIKNFASLKWKITAETKKAGNWTIRKAIPENDFIALPGVEVWFIEDVALPFGPMHYFGLPGLVFEVIIPNFVRITFSGMKHAEINLAALTKKQSGYKSMITKKEDSSLEDIKQLFSELSKHLAP